MMIKTIQANSKTEKEGENDVNYKINASDEEDSNDLLISSDDNEEEEFEQTRMKPPIAINWEHIIKEHNY